MKVPIKADNVFTAIIRVLFGFAAFLIGSMMLIVIFDVVARLLWKPLVETIEIVELSLLFFIFAGATWALRRDKHVRIDLVINYLKPKPKAVVNTITFSASGIMFLILSWGSLYNVIKSYQLGEGSPGILNPPKFILLSVILVGSFLLFIECLRKAAQYSRGWRILPDEGEEGSPVSG